MVCEPNQPIVMGDERIPSRHALFWVLMAGVAILVGCPPIPPTKVPMDTLFYGTEGQGNGTLILFLPGFGSAAQDFEKKGFVAAVKEQAPSIDVLAADAHFGYYKERTVVERLWQDAVQPAMQSGHDEIWLVGTSMGGMAAVAFAREHPDAVSGLVLLSPYLGPRKFIAGIEEAGGLAGWSPSEEDTIYDQLWTWLRGYQDGSDRPEMILAFGERDRLNPAHEILAAILPPDKVLRTDGGHGWRVWKPLWQEILKLRFDSRSVAPAGDRSGGGLWPTARY